MIRFKGAHFPHDIMLAGVRWYVAYPLSYRHVEELMAERGGPVDHATLQRWVVKYRPTLEAAALRFLKKAIRRHGIPKTITLDGSTANKAVIKSYNTEHLAPASLELGDHLLGENPHGLHHDVARDR